MKDFAGKTAIITGAGGGIGRALAHRAAALGMKVVLADISEKDLETVAGELSGQGANFLTVRADVSRFEELEHLAQAAEERFGNVHLLFNNAGVSSPPRLLWESSLEDWDWVLGVNLRSVVCGVKVFVPRMLRHGESAHIVNTASIAGLISNSRMNTYGVTKHAVVALSETLYLDLREVDANIGVSVLCPGWIKTNIHLSERNRRAEERTVLETVDEGTQRTAGVIMEAVKGGLEPADVAQAVFEEIEKESFYILTHPPFNKLVEARLGAILGGRMPRASF